MAAIARFCWPEPVRLKRTDWNLPTFTPQLRNILDFVYSSASPMSPILRPLLLFTLCFSPLARSADVPATKLKYGAWGFDLSGMDQKTKSGDDFFRYANGTWLDKTQIPPDKSAYSMRIIMTDFTEQRLRELMEAGGAKLPENPSTLEEKAGAFYHSFMDETRVEQLGVKAIEPELNDLKNAKTRDDF